MPDYRTPSRPVFLNLFRIRFPLTAVMSILHRLSGVLLFAALPVLLYGLQLSLQSRAGFAAVRDALGSLPGKLVLILLLWALLHHFLAGIRYLLVDMDLFLSRNAARGAAVVVFIIEFLVLALILAGVL